MNLILKRLANKLAEVQDSDRIVIWGAGLLGRQCQTYMQTHFPEKHLVGFVDSSVSDVNEGEGLYPLSHLQSLSPDLLIIASIVYRDEICSRLGEQFPQFTDCVFAFEMEAALAEKIAQETLNRNQIVALLYEYPEHGDLWKLLAGCADNNEERELFLRCAEAVSPTD